MISLLRSAGHSDAAVVLRTGHRDSCSLQSYHNLRGNQGEDLLRAVFGGLPVTEKDGEVLQKRVSGIIDPTPTHVGISPKIPRTGEHFRRSSDLLSRNITETNCTFKITYMHKNE